MTLLLAPGNRGSHGEQQWGSFSTQKSPGVIQNPRTLALNRWDLSAPHQEPKLLVFLFIFVFCKLIHCS